MVKNNRNPVDLTKAKREGEEINRRTYTLSQWKQTSVVMARGRGTGPGWRWVRWEMGYICKCVYIKTLIK